MGLFGQALYESHHSCESEPFFVCNEQVEDQLDLNFYLTPQPDSLEAILLEQVMGRCLDIGCGAGRILRYLDAKGYRVVGIDVDPILIRLCRELGSGSVHVTSWERMAPLGKFDTLLLLNRSMGIGGDLAGVRRLLTQCAASASSSGILLFDSYETANANNVLERKLRYRYRGQYGTAFPWISVGSEMMDLLLTEAGWVRDTVIREGDRYGMIARRAQRALFRDQSPKPDGASLGS